MDKAKFNELLDRLHKIPMENILSMYGIKKDHKTKNYFCPFHSEKSGSASVFFASKKGYEMFTCFGCNKKADNLDIIMHFGNYRSKGHALECFFSGENKKYIPPVKRIVEEVTTKEYDKSNLIIDIELTSKYLSSRGLDPKKAKRNLYNNNFKMYREGQKQNIVYDFNDFGVVKGVYTKNNVRYKKNLGSPAPVLLFNKEKDSILCFICEGIEDSLTALEMGYHSICLNSVSNIDKLLNDFQKMDYYCKYKYIIATDNDKAGFNCMEQLQEYFNSNNINYDIFIDLYTSGKKDLNEYYKANSK